MARSAGDITTADCVNRGGSEVGAVARPELAVAAASFPAVIDLAPLDERSGFRSDGVDAYDQSGATVSSPSDRNGDGFDDRSPFSLQEHAGRAVNGST